MNVRLCWSEFLWLSPEIGILIRMFVILLSPQEANAADTALQVRRFCTVFLITVPLLALAIVFFGVAIGGDNDLFGDREIGRAHV